MADVRRISNAISKLSDLAPTIGASPPWGLDAIRGRLAELSGAGAQARLTVAFGLVLESQRCAEPVAWIQIRGSSFFPRDVADGGVDLESLPVVHMKDAASAARAADQLARSGAFGLIVVDLGRFASGVPVPLLTRLVGLAQKHDTAFLFLTEKASEASSLSSLVSLRAEAASSPRGRLWDVRVSVLKDKRRGSGFTRVETCRAPAGLC